MKIGILTFHYASNYGAVLQCYALSQYLKQLGHQVLVLDYRPSEVYDYYRKWRWRRCGLIGQNFKNLILNNKFDYFRKRFLRLSNNRFDSYEELDCFDFNGDLILLGSDQIWNPALFDGSLDPAYFGQFKKKACCIASLSASFGSSDSLNSKHYRLLNKFLNKLDLISVRETRSARAIDGLGKTKITVLTDPVFLHKNYDELLEGRVPKCAYLVVFALQESKELKRIYTHWSKKLKLKIVLVNPSFRFVLGDNQACYPTPGKWLKLIKNASLVITNSFHASAFSILFKTNFYVISLEGEMKARNERIDELLGWSGLTDRILRGSYDLEKKEYCLPYDRWHFVHDKISEKRSELTGYINEVLSFAKERIN